MKSFKTLFLGLATATVMLLSACAPTSKSDYLKAYSEFIDEVAANHTTYTESDWKKAAAKYEKFSGQWHDKFKSELTISDNVKVATLSAQWLVYFNLQ